MTDTEPTAPDEVSLATGLRSLGDPSIEYPLEPPLTRGCPETSDDEVQYPLEVTYNLDDVDPTLFDRGGSIEGGDPLSVGLDRWAPLLPPLAVPSMGEGETPSFQLERVADEISLESDLYLKDESQNPTWSQKDRLARCAVSAAVRSGSRGVVASSTGNHGAAVAAYAARAGLEAVVVTAPETPAAVQRFIDAYGGTLLAIDDEAASGSEPPRNGERGAERPASGVTRLDVVDRLAERGYHPVSSRTAVHTGHPWGPEGYKTIAYELYRDLGRIPGTVAVPTCYAELLYGVWKGFRDLERLGVVDETPRMLACEPAARGPLREALAADDPVATVEANPTEAYSIATTTSSVRGRRAVEESDGEAIGFTEDELASAESILSRQGSWQESAGAGSIAGLLRAIDAGLEVEGPVVAIGTSSGLKNGESRAAPLVDSDWEAIEDALRAAGHLDSEDRQRLDGDDRQLFDDGRRSSTRTADGDGAHE
ncbi:threonine synthase [Halovivax gelatinilyticus]|uniref:threonine synthase n=1 Tax=Halovivax gelatinilyticus TaxID=2961597 RepID=UPI0020CA84E3|nr:pyridoxal-phosphate dependent enzyme [Halovivax gelatinilyticus]